jgi:hypothetical protein
MICVAFSKSFEAPVVINSSPKKTSSATLHPKSDVTSSKNFALEERYISSDGEIRVTQRALPLRTIDIFSTASAYGNK